MIQVLFVCLGNICRSPMAEAVMRHKVKQAGLEHKIAVDSAGTGDWHIGKPPHAGTKELLDRHRIQYDGIKARQVRVDDAVQFDYIAAMDAQNEKDLSRIFGGPDQKVFKLLELVRSGEQLDVPDPYYTGNFDEVYEMIDEACDKLLHKIQTEHSL